jgi:hypothetical protein
MGSQSTHAAVDGSTCATTLSSSSTLEQIRLSHLEHKVNILQIVLSSLFPEQQDFATATATGAPPSPQPMDTANTEPCPDEAPGNPPDMVVYMTPSDNPNTDPAK